MKRVNVNIDCNSGHNILELYNILLKIDSPQVKRNLIISIANLVHQLPQELPNDLRLRILGNKEILEKSQIWMDS